jgi:hypothetical protein
MWSSKASLAAVFAAGVCAEADAAKHAHAKYVKQLSEARIPDMAGL